MNQASGYFPEQKIRGLSNFTKALGSQGCPQQGDAMMNSAQTLPSMPLLTMTLPNGQQAGDVVWTGEMFPILKKPWPCGQPPVNIPRYYYIYYPFAQKM